MMLVLALFLQTEPVKHPQAHDMGGGGGSEQLCGSFSGPKSTDKKKNGGK